jgi:hypothetical protein
VWLLREPKCRFLQEHTAHFVFLRSVRRLLVTANVFPSSPILVTLMMGAVSSFETSVLTRATRRNIPKDSILQGRRWFVITEEDCVIVKFMQTFIHVNIFVHTMYTHAGIHHTFKRTYITRVYASIHTYMHTYTYIHIFIEAFMRLVQFFEELSHSALHYFMTAVLKIIAISIKLTRN